MRVQTLVGKKWQQRYIAVFSILWLAFYVLFAPETKAFHRFFHSHQQVISHSELEEKDPCHRTIYHHDGEGCQHPSHIVVTDQCNLCNLFFHSDPFLLSEFKSPLALFFRTDLILSSRQPICIDQSVGSSRAPPAV